ncbi:hypothetical protein RFI_26864 [Reticulomyxa filosa]|uniref:C2H2-type domain-containing protein n=1 Tax=Reticulomyxa filosa TaxID=46433 RepID=X6M9F7_RETFI|nr:hypothetical protein RFI_26864 [Reticulomyxa filosa]|eukprot:ETO10514.1 hypothetical protein RFI_26864 [Reticulomyxa filosa]
MTEAYKSLNEKADQICARKFGQMSITATNVMKNLMSDDKTTFTVQAIPNGIPNLFHYDPTTICVDDIKWDFSQNKKKTTQKNKEKNKSKNKNKKPKQMKIKNKKKKKLKKIKKTTKTSIPRPALQKRCEKKKKMDTQSMDHNSNEPMAPPQSSLAEEGESCNDGKTVDDLSSIPHLEQMQDLTYFFNMPLLHDAQSKLFIDNTTNLEILSTFDKENLPTQYMSSFSSSSPPSEDANDPDAELRRASLLASFGVKSAFTNLKHKMGYHKDTETLATSPLPNLPNTFAMTEECTFDAKSNCPTLYTNRSESSSSSNSSTCSTTTSASDKKFTCTKCNQSFAQKCHFIRHERLQHGISNESERYICQYCPKSFKQKSNRNIHELIHSSDYFISHFWRCDYCPLEVPETKRRFTRKSSLKRHIDSKHLEVTWDQVKKRLPEPPVRETDDEWDIHSSSQTIIHSDQSSQNKSIELTANDKSTPIFHANGSPKKKRGRPVGSKNAKKKTSNVLVTDIFLQNENSLSQNSVSTESLHFSNTPTTPHLAVTPQTTHSSNCKLS